MDPDRLDYPAFVQEALRDVVRRVLAQVAEHGLPGDHHFFIAFRTEDPGVVIPRFLRDLYPEETKIVLQYQFWDLAVDDDLFSVTLTFGGQRQRLTVPFAALTVFVDPAAEFMLRFDGTGVALTGDGVGDLDDADDSAEGANSADADPPLGPRAVPDKPGEVLRFDPSRRK